MRGRRKAMKYWKKMWGPEKTSENSVLCKSNEKTGRKKKKAPITIAKVWKLTKVV